MSVSQTHKVCSLTCFRGYTYMYVCTYYTHGHILLQPVNHAEEELNENKKQLYCFFPK